MAVTLARKVAFSSGHRYWRTDWSAEENRARFGPWASPYNHGHNYQLWVSARGQINSENGMVVNIKTIDTLLKDRVVRVFDQKSINDEVDTFKTAAPTVENLLLDIRNRIGPLPAGATLTELRLEETPTFYGEWIAESNMLTITRSYEFAASHRLHVPELTHEENIELFGKCNNPNGHGHNYVLEITISGEPDPQTGMIADLGEIDRVVEELVVNRYDHKNLNLDIEEFSGKNTTSEVVAQAIFDRLNGHVPGTLERVRLYETARNIFEVTR